MARFSVTNHFFDRFSQRVDSLASREKVINLARRWVAAIDAGGNIHAKMHTTDGKVDEWFVYYQYNRYVIVYDRIARSFITIAPRVARNHTIDDQVAETRKFRKTQSMSTHKTNKKPPKRVKDWEDYVEADGDE